MVAATATRIAATAYSLDRSEQYVDAHTLARAAITAQAVGAAQSAFQGFTDWYDTDAITALCTALASRVQGLQKQQAAVTNAYLARATTNVVGKRITPPPVIDVRELRQGITHAGAYGRVTDMYRWRVSEGDDTADATRQAVERAAVIAETDIDLAFRDMADAFMRERDVATYRRVIRPERSTSGTCGLCIVAADRIYNTGELMPLHARCKCTVLPITDDHDPGHSLNGDDLRAIYAAAGSTKAADLKRTRVSVNEHGELGPVLTYSQNEWRGPQQVEADTRS